MDSEKLLQINADASGKPVAVGGTYVELADCTTGKFNTESPMDFIQYLSNFQKPPVFFNSEGILAFRAIDPKHGERAVAICEIKKSKVLQYLLEKEGKEMTIREFDDFLRTTREFISGQESLKIIDFLENAQIQKVKTVKRQRDNRGNFNYTVSSEKGQNDFEFPKSLTFRVPLIKHIPEEKEIEFDFFFLWAERGESVSFTFALKNIRLDEIVEEAIEEIISKLLDEADTNNRKGAFQIKDETDSWRFHQTPLRITR